MGSYNVGGSGQAAVAAEAGGPERAGDRGDDTRRQVDFADRIVERVGDVQIGPGAVHCHGRRRRELGGRGWAAVTGIAERAVACDRDEAAV